MTAGTTTVPPIAGAPGEDPRGNLLPRRERCASITQSRRGADPLAADPPFQPSFETASPPDQVFTRVDDDDYSAWCRVWSSSSSAPSQASGRLHLHHLTPINGRRAPLSRRAAHRPPARHRALMLQRSSRPARHWTYATVADACALGDGCERLLVLSPTPCAACPTCSAWILIGSSGPQRLRPAASIAAAGGDAAAWLSGGAAGRSHAGWDESGKPGSVAYS